MVITHHGAQFFKVSVGNTTLALNPVSKSSKLSSSRFGADVALISINDPDMNGVDQVTHGEREPVSVTGPGEYEIGQVAIRGFASSSNYNGKDRPNTIYLITLENMNLVFLGALSKKDIKEDALGAIDEVHVLFVPIGGDGVLDPAQAHDISVSLEPHIIIPMHFNGLGKKDSLKTFLKEEGAEGVKATDKLMIKQRDAESRNGEVVVLKP